MKKTVRLSVLVLGIVIFIMLITVNAFAEDTIIASGSDDHLAWSLDNNGVLTFTGNDKIPSNGEWNNYYESIRTIIIEPDITEISEFSFDNFKNLISVSVPSSVSYIGAYAFSGCENLLSFTIPSGIDRIEEGTFKDCNKMTSISIPNTISSIGTLAFSNCKSLTAIAIPPYVTNIGKSAFSFCSGLNTITIPSSIVNIEEMAFHACSELESLVFEGDAPIVISSDNDNASFPSDIIVYYHALSSGWTEEKWNGYNSVKIYETIAKGTLNSSNNVKWTLDSNGLLTISGSGSIPNYGSNGYYTNKPAYSAYEDIITDVIIKSGITRIGDYTFAYTKNVSSVTIPNSVTQIGKFAFGSCNITSLEIPTGVRSIAEYALNDCDRLESVIILPGLITIGDYAFNDCDNLNIVTISDTVTSIGSHSFADCTKLSSVFLPNSITTIGEYAFENCCKLESVNIPSKVIDFGKDAFGGCSELTSIIIDDGVKRIGVNAFHDCVKLTAITIPSSVIDIESGAFRDCTNLSSLTFSEADETRLSIHDEAFYGCKALTEITFPKNVTNFGKKAFSCCDNLNSVTFENDPPFVYGALSSEASFPSDIVINHYSAFFWSDFSSSGYKTNAIDGRNFTIASGFCGGDKDYEFLPELSCYSNLTWVLDGNGVLTVSGDWDMIDYQYYNEQPWTDYSLYIKSVVIGDGVTSIGANAFSHCEELESIYYSDSIMKIGMYAFSACKYKLESVVIPDGITELGEGAFADCWNLKSIVIPSSIKALPPYAFQTCSSLVSVSLPSCLVSIGSAAFMQCSKLSTIDLPNGITKIGDSTFAYCDGLLGITIPESVEEIGGGAFLNCMNLESITIPSNVSSIGGSAFRYCYSLDNVIFMGNAPTVYAAKTNTPSFEQNTILNYNAFASGWTEGTWNGYKTQKVYLDISEADNYVSLSLTGNIGVNFYLDLDAYNNIGKVEIYHADPALESGERISDVFESFDEFFDNGVYKFSVQAAAAQLTENISVVIYNLQNDVLYSKNITVRDILETYIEYYKDIPEISDLCRNMLTYSGKAQQYFGYRTDDLADANYSADLSTVTGNLVNKYSTSFIDTDENDNFTCYSQSFSCRSNTIMKYSFHTITGTNINDYSVKFINGGEGKTIELTSKGKDIVVNVSEIVAAQLDDFYTFEIYCDNILVGSLTGSPMCYINTVLNSGTSSVSLIALSKAIYLYNQAANAYFAR